MSFVRYQKSGSSERKTWESSAAGANIWTAGTFVEVGDIEEGKALVLSNSTERFSADSWSFGENQTEALNAPQNEPSEQNTNPIPSSAYQTLAPTAQIKAYAGKNRTVLVGAATKFEGYAEDLKGNPLDGARFVWNFGDGSVGEGKNVFHTYNHLGTYTVFLDVSAGLQSGGTMVTVTTIPSPLAIGSIEPGDSGAITIKNNSSNTIEISGFGIRADNQKPFYFPSNTFLGTKATVALSNKLSDLVISENSIIQLLYPDGSLLSTSSLPIINTVEPQPKKQTKIISAKPPTANTFVEPFASSNTISSEKQNSYPASVSESTHTKDYTWIFIGTGIGILGGIGALIMKRFFILS